MSLSPLSKSTNLGGRIGLVQTVANARAMRREIRGTEPATLLSRTLAGIGVPPFDIVIARAGARVIGLELSADAPAVLGSQMAPAGGEELEWA